MPSSVTQSRYPYTFMYTRYRRIISFARRYPHLLLPSQDYVTRHAETTQPLPAHPRHTYASPLPHFSPSPPPAMRTYQYTPLPLGIDATWTHPIQLYDHLLDTPSERDRIRREVCAHMPDELFIAEIQHPVLRGMLKYSTIEDDDAFLRRITTCLTYETHPEYVLLRYP